MKVIDLLTSYPRHGEESRLLAIISFIQEKRKKGGFWSREEEVLRSIRKGLITLRPFSSGHLSVIVDELCSIEPIFRLEDVSSWEDALRSLDDSDYKAFISTAISLSSFRAPARNIRLRGIFPSSLYSMLVNSRGVDIEPPKMGSCDPISLPEFKELSSRDKIDSYEKTALKFREMASRIRFIGERLAQELNSWIDRYPADSPSRREYLRERDRIVSASNSLASKLGELAKQYEMLISTLTSAPSVNYIIMPVYLVETKGKDRRKFVIANLRFKRPGLSHKIKNFFGTFDSLFEETDLNRELSSILRIDRINWGPNLLSEDIKEPIYGELARLEEEGYIDEKYTQAIADLISKSLFLLDERS